MNFSTLSFHKLQFSFVTLALVSIVSVLSKLWFSVSSCLQLCCCSAVQSCPILCDPMDCSIPGLPVPHPSPLQEAAICPVTSLMAQWVKNPPTVQETQVWSLGQEDPRGMKWQPTPIFLPENSHGQRRLVGNSPWGHKELDMTECSCCCC